MLARDELFYPHDARWQKVIKMDANGSAQLINYYTKRTNGVLVFQHVFLYDVNGDYLEGGIIDVKRGDNEILGNDPMFL